MSSRIIRASNADPKTIGAFKFTPANPGSHPQTPTVLPGGLASNLVMSARPAFGAVPVPDAVQQECELLLLQTRAKVSEIEKEAYEIGFAQGQKAGLEVGEKMVESLLKQYSVSLEELNKLRKEVFSSSERQVIRLALEIAKKIVKREVAIDEELILTLVKVALDRVTDQALITIRVNPKDYHAIERHHASRPDAGALNETVKLIEDPLIGRGGCVIETDSGTIDARIEEQLREIEKGFFE
jgi:flagellar assembly protein FliH